MARLPRSPPYKHLADIFGKMKRAKQERFLDDLQERNEDAAEQIRALMFTFEDLVRLEPQGVQELLRQVDQKQLATALKGASTEVTALFFDNMSERAGKVLREEMDAMGPVRMAEMEKAQAAIVSNAKSLADSGKIIIRNGEEDEYIS